MLTSIFEGGGGGREYCTSWNERYGWWEQSYTFDFDDDNSEKEREKKFKVVKMVQ